MVDLAAGTGKLTRALTERFRRVIAVEPNDEMRRFINCAEAVKGTGREHPASNSSVDVVFVADAFHWFACPAALAEIARVLRAQARSR